MSSPSEIVEFLKARLDEDEAAAKAWLLFGNPDATQREHTARHDPARVLAEVEAKRRRLARHVPTEDPLHGTLCSWCSVPQVSVYQAWPCADIRDDVAVYADHPNCRDEWRS